MQISFYSGSASLALACFCTRALVLPIRMATYETNESKLPMAHAFSLELHASQPTRVTDSACSCKSAHMSRGKMDPK